MYMATQTKRPGTADNQNEPVFNENPGSLKNTNPATDSDITSAELELLDEAGVVDDEPGDDTLLDDTDEDGDELNEADDLTGDDLDVPGIETDDEDELLGEEDEENNSYSISDQDDEEDDNENIL